MCGLTGLFVPRQCIPRDAPLERMLGVMRHRGPDGTGSFVSADRRFQSGFARLSIIDVETSGQPIHDAAGRYVLLGNGEIYNYIELRSRPGLDGYPYRTAGDMEVILPLFQSAETDTDWLGPLNGMFGLALYDRREHRLTLARDRLGIKPLYWARTPEGSILFASEIKPLLASGLVERAVDDEAVAAYLAHGYVPAPKTLFRNVRKLQPGHVLTVEADGRVEARAYWSPRPTPGQPVPASKEEASEQLLPLLEDAVRLQLRSDVPLGLLLSGGIDSGLVAALAACQSERPLKTYTVRFEGAPVDESPLAHKVAERYGTDHTRFDLDSEAIIDLMPSLAWYCDDPIADASLLPNFLVQHQLGQSVRVALNGTGGDELFAGYGRYFQTPLERRYLAVPAALRRTLEPILGAAAPFVLWRLQRAGAFSDDPAAYVHAHSTYFPPPLLARLGGGFVMPEIAHRRGDDPTWPRQTRLLAADIRTYLPDNLLTLLDRTSMSASVEGRVPFLDHRLAEAALALPEHVRTPGRKQKGLLRRIAGDFLPMDVLTAPKQGFASPVPAWLRAGLTPLARALLTRPRSLARGWWTAEAVEWLLADPDRHGHRIYALLMLELVVRLHVEESVLAEPAMTLRDFAYDGH